MKRQGLAVLLHSGNVMPRDNRIRRMLRNDIPVLETGRTEEIRNVIHDFGIEVLNSHHWHIQRYPIVDSTVFADLPRHAATLHGMIEADGGYEVTPEQLRLVDKYVDTWVYTADKNVEPFQSAGLHDKNPSRFVKIPNGMEPPKIEPIPRGEMNIPDNAFVLCNVSRAIPEKGWAETIEVVKKARELSGKDIRLILVGNGMVYDEYCRKGVPDFVYMPGFDDRSVGYYATSDMGIMLTRFRSESFPLTITDCMFAGKPYIASDVGEIRNMLTANGELAGAVFELDDWTIPVYDVARIVAEFTTDNDKYEQAKSRVPQAAQRYTIENVARQYLDIFETYSDMPSLKKTCLMYSDDQWFEIMNRSVNEPLIDAIPMPGFPDADQQVAMVGSAFEASLKEADAFTKQVKQFMREQGTGLTPHSKILDFGTRWGRIYRFFLNTVLPENVLGTDVDQIYIDLCRQTIPWGRFEKNNAFPPMGYENNSFDAVVGYSVFSHLNKDVGLRWIEEFARIIKPGGILAITTHSRDFIDYCDRLRKSGKKHTSEWHIRLAEKAFLDKKKAYRNYDSGRFLYVAGMDSSVRKADVYGDAILSPKYVEREWTKYLDLVGFIDDKAILPQALIVMRKPIAATGNNKNASNVQKLSFYETDIYRKYKDTEESFHKEMVGFCPICEEKATFVSDHKWLRDNYRCVKCRSIPRQRYVQHILYSLVPGWQNMVIHESSPCTDFIKRCAAGYTASQFYLGKEPGERVGEFTNENLEALTFTDNTFDLFLSQDVLEHVFNPEKAIKEMLRVIKPGGYVVFTIPVFHAKKTVQRARLDENGNVEYIEDAVYHGNPIDSEGSLAVWDYGDNFINDLKKWATDNEVDVFNHPIQELGIEGEFLDVFYVKKCQSDAKRKESTFVEKKQDDKDTAGIPATVFRADFIRKHTNNRLEHLKSLALDLSGKTVLELGAGVGDFTEFFLDSNCIVTAVEGRKENVDMIRKRFADCEKLRVLQMDLNNAEELPEQSYDIVFAYGILYHLRNPSQALEYMKKYTGETLCLQTCVSPKNDLSINPVDEDTSNASQALDGVGCRPTRPWLYRKLKKMYRHVYLPITQPDHPQFLTDWEAAESKPPNGLYCSVFIASDEKIESDIL
ncbi:MAG: methyltransferase domain-containing protein, partial [Deltaproteobacteria bacterium]|nr:methyltransferase domain-containing protein [Deltaproteobacteria bacterium]